MAACLTMGACDFLDVVPQSSATIDDIYKTQNQAEQMVLTCYKEIPTYYHPQQFPDWTAGNDFVTGWYGSVRYFHWKSLAYGQESATSTYYSLWSNSAASYPTGYVQKLIWEGSWTCSGWAGNQDLAWGGYDWSTFQEGQTIIFVVGFVDPTSGWAAISPRMGDGWANLSVSQFDLVPGTEDQRVEYTPTAQDISDLVNKGGLVVTGDGFILKQVLIR